MLKYYNAWLFAMAIILSSFNSFAQTKYQAPYASNTPVIDGLGDDPCWDKGIWYSVDQLWLLDQPDAADFSGKFKVCWDENKLYVLAEITDDVLYDYYSDPLESYWEDDTWEIFLDEDASGGEHETSYNAFAYHISQFFDVADIGPGGTRHLFNDHVEVARTNSGTNYVWEGAFDIYDDTYDDNGPNTPVTLYAGKILGFAMAYCDNDGGSGRESFIGSEVVEGSNKNVAYQNADVFGDLELVQDVAPQFTHVKVATGLTNPTSFTIADDGRIFIAEQKGQVKVVEDGQLLSTPVLNITVNEDGPEGYTERGLLGITLDPDFATNNYMYIFYTTPDAPVHSRVVRYTLNGNVADMSSAQTIKDLDNLSSAHNHNGGALHFGPDGKLYIATGENATSSNSQNLDNTHGKILRLNPDGSIPGDNPFPTGSDAQKMIWAYGLRNPFTFDIQQSTSRIFVNDVGQENWEEINDVTVAGQNFGWPHEEGMGSEYVNPIYTYPINGMQECAVTGGCFFEPIATNYPVKYRGKYFFMDYCSTWMKVLDPATGTILETFSEDVANSPIGVDVHPDGNIYYINRGSYDGSGIGSVYKITYSGNLEPEVQSHPESQSIAESQPVTFSVQVSGAVPLSYQWYKDGLEISGATSRVYTIGYVEPQDAGNYTVTATNSYGSVTSNAATLTVTAFNSKPVPTITSPSDGSSFIGGQSFTFTGEATDAEDGTIPASSLKWKIDLHHGEHVHDGIFVEGSSTYNYTIPTFGHTETDIWYRVYLVATDAGGLSDTTYIELIPEKVNLSFATLPAGLSITLDGQPLQTPATIESVTGIIRTLGVETPQLLDNKAWGYVSWSNGRTQTHTISTPGTNRAYTASFEEVPLTFESLDPIQDAYIQYTFWSADDASTPYGANDPLNLVVKNFADDPDRITYIKFDLSNLGGIPENLLTATLILNGYMQDEDGATTLNIDVFESASSDWNEETITWNNSPGETGNSIANFDVSDFSNSTYEIDISDFVISKLQEAADSLSIVLKANTDHKNRFFISSKESGTGPALELRYEDVVTAVYKSTDVQEGVSIFPNPATDNLSIISSDNLAGSKIEITDQYSRQVSSYQVGTSQNTYHIDISQLPKGFYFIHVKNGKNTETRKFIKN